MCWVFGDGEDRDALAVDWRGMNPLPRLHAGGQDVGLRDEDPEPVQRDVEMGHR